MAIYSGDFIGHWIQQDGFYELHQLRLVVDLIREDLVHSTVVDVGANIGNHTCFLGRHCAKIIALEPNPKAFQLLLINAPKNATCLRVAASESRGEATLSVSRTNLGGASLEHDSLARETAKTEVRCRTEPLDEVLLGVDPKDIGLIKIDVEGHELSVLVGASETLSRTDAVIMMESFVGSDQMQVERVLHEFGYKHFLDILPRRNWRWGGRSMITKLVESVVLGVPEVRCRAMTMESLVGTNHSVLLASKRPLRSV